METATATPDEGLRRDLEARVARHLRSLEHVYRDLLTARSGPELQAIEEELKEWEG